MFPLRRESFVFAQCVEISRTSLSKAGFNTVRASRRITVGFEVPICLERLSVLLVDWTTSKASTDRIQCSFDGRDVLAQRQESLSSTYELTVLDQN